MKFIRRLWFSFIEVVTFLILGDRLAPRCSLNFQNDVDSGICAVSVIYRVTVWFAMTKSHKSMYYASVYFVCVT